MSATALSHSATPSVPPISTLCTGRFSVDFGTLYKLVTIVSGVAIAVFAILEAQYLVAACALTLSAFAINSCFNREPIPQNQPLLSAVTSTQTPPSLGNPLDPSAASTVAGSESDDGEYSSFDGEDEPRSAQPIRQAVSPLIENHRTEGQRALGHPLVRQNSYSDSPYQPTRTRPFSQTPFANKSSSEEGERTSGSENEELGVYSLNFDNDSGSEDDQGRPDIVASRKLERERIATLLDENE